MQEGGTAETGLSGHHEPGAVRPQPVEQGGHRPSLWAPPVQSHRRTYDRVSGHSREVTRA
ncbi:hypothetical protein GCM10010238_62550 [Streptomyces griseoviridis]|uniref:Uncharacterized protein n=1 Tax=Streptomyces griseoviridis TaxID=45398 RepID=A0A918GUH3_STRGD|nr:hypothetical protein GCM10010238_62550 [Streptomyces niveoruber]